MFSWTEQTRAHYSGNREPAFWPGQASLRCFQVSAVTDTLDSTQGQMSQALAQESFLFRKGMNWVTHLLFKRPMMKHPLEIIWASSMRYGWVTKKKQWHVFQFQKRFSITFFLKKKVMFKWSKIGCDFTSQELGDRITPSIHLFEIARIIIENFWWQFDHLNKYSLIFSS